VLQFPPVVRGSWASGQPRLDMRLKSGQRPLQAGMVLHLRAIDVGPLQVGSQRTLLCSHNPVCVCVCHAVIHKLFDICRESNCMCRGIPAGRSGGSG
jgi:hypothetical protein